jgi:hypothetical protein
MGGVGIVGGIYLGALGASLTSRFSSERSGAANLSIAMEGFSDSIFEQGLMDSSHQGVNFTWSNN